MERPRFKKLRALLKQELERQASEPFVSVSPGWLSGFAVYSGFRDREVHDAWPALAKEFGLVQDTARSWTLPGRGVTVEQIVEIEKNVGRIIKEIKNE